MNPQRDSTAFRVVDLPFSSVALLRWTRRCGAPSPCHSIQRRKLAARGEDSLQRDDEHQAEEGLHVIVRLAATGDG